MTEEEKGKLFEVFCSLKHDGYQERYISSMPDMPDSFTMTSYAKAAPDRKDKLYTALQGLANSAMEKGQVLAEKAARGEFDKEHLAGVKIAVTFLDRLSTSASRLPTIQEANSESLKDLLDERAAFMRKKVE